MITNIRLFKAGLYIRLSREDGDKEESYSVANQRTLLRNFVNGEDDIVESNIYIDDGFTGTNFNRPQFKRMIEDIDKGTIDCVIVKDLSRFGRDYIEVGRYVEREFPARDVRFIAINDGVDTYKLTNEMMVPFKNIFNDQYSKDISKKVKSAITTKQQSGDFIGAFASYGYKKSPTNKNKLVVDEYASEIVNRIFDLYIEGYGKSRISKILNDEGILCPSEYKKSCGENYTNGLRLEVTNYWTYSTINKILQNEIYIGNMVQRTREQKLRGRQKKLPKEKWIIVQDTHEPIIDMNKWNKVQVLLKKRTRTLDFETNKSIFAGFLRCGDCGRGMAKVVYKCKTKEPQIRYHCGTYKHAGKNACSPHGINHNVIEQILLDDLRTIIRGIDDLKALVKKHKNVDNQRKKTLDIELLKLQNEYDRIKRMIKGIYEDYREALITKEEYISYKQDYIKKLELLEDKIKIISDKKNKNSTEHILQSPWVTKLLEIRDIESLDRDIVVEMVDVIKIYEDNRIEITYNFSDELKDLFQTEYSI